MGNRRILKPVIIAAVLLVAIIVTPIAFSHATDISNYNVELSQEEFEYTGEDITPDVEVSKGPLTLKPDRDYRLRYRHNKDAGTASVRIIGKGTYRGSCTREFYIEKAEQRIKGKDRISGNIESDINMDQTAATDIRYISGDEKIAKITADGKVIARRAGEITVTVIAEAGENYEQASKKVQLKITETDRQKVIRTTLAWARKIAADDSYTYGKGQCPFCHKDDRLFDCIAFVSAAYWHGGKVKMMGYWCRYHNHTSVIRESMIKSKLWKSMGRLKPSELKPGDVMYYYRPGGGLNGSGWFHVEMYDGNGMVVGAHTFNGHSCISEEPFNSYFLSYSDVYRYVGKD